MAHGLNDFDGENPLLGPLEGVGPENLDLSKTAQSMKIGQRLSSTYPFNRINCTR